MCSSLFGNQIYLDAMCRSDLIKEYKEVVYIKLPALAKRYPHIPIKYDHCFARVILDNTVHSVWYRVIKKPAVYNMTKSQLIEAIKLGNYCLANPEAISELNKKSLIYRNKIKP